LRFNLSAFIGGSGIFEEFKNGTGDKITGGT
jgi:hypothetical protein